jgi:hypothetical protein
MTADLKLKQLPAKVYDDARGGLRKTEDPSAYAVLRHDFGETTVQLIGFLYHVIPHLKAAGRLLVDDISDPLDNTAPAQKRRNAAKGGRTPKSRSTGTR